MHEIDQHSLVSPTSGAARMHGAIVCTICVWLLVQIFFVWNGGRNGVFNSPDANANYYFAKRVFEGQSVAVPIDQTLDREASAFLTTRSTRVIGDAIIPVGFAGMAYLYGILSRAVFFNLIVYLTPFFAAGASYLFFLLLVHFFSQRIAFIGTVLLLLHPAWLFYTNDSMFPNVLFVSLVISVAWFFQVAAVNKDSALPYFASASGAALALFVRASEALWFMPLMLAAVYSARNKHSVRSFAFLFSCFLVFLFFFWYVQSSIVGGIIPAGYNVGPFVQPSFLGKTFQLLLPFGFSTKLFFRNVFYYGFILFWPWTCLMLGGVAIMLRQEKKRTWMQYLAALVFVAIVLFFFYGSWRVVDSPNPFSVTIANSFVRYFLPFYVFSIPAVAYALDWILDRLSMPKLHLALLASLLFFAGTSVALVFFDPDEGIIVKRRELLKYDRVAAWVRNNTENDSIVLTDKGDKYIWPHRLVMRVPETPQSISALISFSKNGIPIWYLGLPLDKEDIQRLNWLWRDAHLAVGEERFRVGEITVRPLLYTNDASP